MPKPIQPSWHPNAANMPFCSESCSSRECVDVDFDGESYINPQYACTAERDLPVDCPEFCEECEVCLPALYLGFKKGESR